MCRLHTSSHNLIIWWSCDDVSLKIDTFWSILPSIISFQANTPIKNIKLLVTKITLRMFVSPDWSEANGKKQQRHISVETAISLNLPSFVIFSQHWLLSGTSLLIRHMISLLMAPLILSNYASADQTTSMLIRIVDPTTLLLIASSHARI